MAKNLKFNFPNNKLWLQQYMFHPGPALIFSQLETDTQLSCSANRTGFKVIKTCSGGVISIGNPGHSIR
jgi:hypothetical protein